METNQHSTQQTTRKAAIGGLAVVGFIALILIGIATAIYAATFLPKAFSRLSSANVYLSSTPSDDTKLEAVNNPSVVVGTSSAPTSIPLSPATNPAPAPTPVATPATPAPTPVYTQPTYHVVPSAPAYYGLADLVTTITSVGYLRYAGDTTSFVSANAVPSGYQGAVRFVIANRGTNVSNSWNFLARLPSNTNADYRSAYQRALNPNDSIVYTLGFDGYTDSRGTIRITADANDNVQESNESNNTDTSSIYVNGTTNYTNTSSYDSNGNYCTYGTYYSNGRYYCNTSTVYNQSTSSYDSNGNYCTYGTYYASGRYYCQSASNTNYSTDNGQYASSGEYCSAGTRYQSGYYYCIAATNSSTSRYDSNGNYCSYGTYVSGNRTYCN